MEIAHNPTGIFRLIGKIVLLGLFVILLAKALLTLLALAAVGLVAYFCARAIYIRRGYLKRILLWTAEMLIRSVIAVFRATAILVAAAGWLFVCTCWVLLRLSQLTLVSAKKKLRRLYTVLAAMLRDTIVACPRLGWAFKISCRAALVNVRRHYRVICGTLVEAASGAVVGAILFNLKSIEGLVFLPELSNVLGARLCAAALFGAFLGIAVSLSRTRGAKEGETGQFPENQN